MIADFGFDDYVESFFETHVWDTNWKVLAENFMESYHLPVCHAATIGGLSKLEEMVCPPGRPAFNYHTILKDDRLKIAVAHPSNTRLHGDLRRTTFLISIYPSLLVTLTPGYFWYLTLHPGRRPGRVRIGFGGGMSPDFADDPDARAHFAAAQDPARRGQRRGPRLHREGVPRPLLRPRPPGPPQPPRAPELRLRPLPRRPARLTERPGWTPVASSIAA